MKLSIVIPIYNSEKIIPTLINSINENLKNFKNFFEIILVNDFSNDQSWNTIIDWDHKSQTASLSWIPATIPNEKMRASLLGQECQICHQGCYRTETMQEPKMIDSCSKQFTLTE